MSLSEYFVHMFEYETWANQIVLDYLRTGRAPDYVLPVFNHLIADITPFSLQLANQPVPDDLDCSPNWSLEECAEHLPKIMGNILTRVKSLEERDFDTVLVSHAPNGREFRDTISAILTEILAHGQHHRGQIEWIVERETGEYLGTIYMRYARLKSNS